MTNYSKARYQELRWCRVARAKRREEVAYFGTLAQSSEPQQPNSARGLGHLYR